MDTYTDCEWVYHQAKNTKILIFLAEYHMRMLLAIIYDKTLQH